MKISKYYLCGILCILIAIALYFTNSLDTFIRPITQPLLMGSSKGKDVLFFGLNGLILIINQIIKDHNISILKKDSDFYLKFSFILLIIIGLIGILTEIYIRWTLSLNVFSIFVVTEPSMTSTSILHSHVFKSIFGEIVTSFISYIPNGIHTGDSLIRFIPDIVKISFILIIIEFITLIKSIENRSLISRLILTLASALGIIGIIDGGISGTPTIGALFLISIILINENISNKLSNSLEPKKEEISKWESLVKLSKTELNKFINDLKNKRNLKYYCKTTIPIIFLVLMIGLHFGIGFAASITSHYEVEIINPHENIDLNQYDIKNISYEEDRIILTISNNYNEMKLLNSLAKTLKNKTSCFSQTENMYSYL